MSELPVELKFTIEVDDEQAPGVEGRWATLKLGGERVYTELVYDRPPPGSGRTRAGQARMNLLTMFARQLERVMTLD